MAAWQERRYLGYRWDRATVLMVRIDEREGGESIEEWLDLITEVLYSSTDLLPVRFSKGSLPRSASVKPVYQGGKDCNVLNDDSVQSLFRSTVANPFTASISSSSSLSSELIELDPLPASFPAVLLKLGIRILEAPRLLPVINLTLPKCKSSPSVGAQKNPPPSIARRRSSISGWLVVLLDLMRDNRRIAGKSHLDSRDS